MTILWIVLALILVHTAPNIEGPVSWRVATRGVCWLIAVLLMVLVAVRVLDFARAVG